VLHSISLVQLELVYCVVVVTSLHAAACLRKCSKLASAFNLKVLAVGRSLEYLL
jgi:hypothetical protein